MPFLRNAWYCASWSHELKDDLVGITLLDERVMLYRTGDGKAAAIGGRCPHRFAPLHRGKRVGDAVQCPYHGLRFDASGACVHNPHGDGAIPSRARVKSYPALERHGAIWLWMGDPGRADESQIPDFSTLSDPQYAVAHGYIHIKANYQLVADNLLDLSHVPFLHPFLANQGPPPPGFQARFELKQDGETVYSYNTLVNTPVSPLYRMLWGKEVEAGEMRAHMRWNPPSNLWLDTGMTYVGRPTSEGPAMPSAHLLAPESESSTHYFWATARDCQVDNVALSEELRRNVASAFQCEDEPMIEACHDEMGTTDLFSLQPVILPGDAAALRARRILTRKMSEERKAEG